MQPEWKGQAVATGLAVSFDCPSQPRSQHWWSFDQVQQVALAHQPLQLHEALSSRSSLSSRSIQCQTLVRRFGSKPSYDALVRDRCLLDLCRSRDRGDIGSLAGKEK
jgi:hypothetical protein